MKLQQYTGPVQAKGLEDTAFYRYNVLLSLNEVGGDPSRFGRIGRGVPRRQRARAAARGRSRCSPPPRTTPSSAKTCARASTCCRSCPTSGAARSRRGCASTRRSARSSTASRRRIAPTSTASTRRSSASGRPMCRRTRHEAPAGLVDRLVRIHAQGRQGSQGPHQLADARNQPYEDALVQFVRRALSGPAARRFLERVPPVPAAIASLGMVNSLAQVTLKLGSPGVPDFYQGTELWDLSLVDPDNRRPVDFAHRAAAARRRGRAAGARNRATAPPAVSQWLTRLAGRPHQAPRHCRRPASAERTAARLSRAAAICRSPPRSPCPAARSRSHERRRAERRRLTPCIFAAPRLCHALDRRGIACAARRASAGRRRGSCFRRAWRTARSATRSPAPRSGRPGPAIPPGFLSVRSSRRRRSGSSGPSNVQCHVADVATCATCYDVPDVLRDVVARGISGCRSRT